MFTNLVPKLGHYFIEDTNFLKDISFVVSFSYMHSRSIFLFTNLMSCTCVILTFNQSF